MRKLYPTMIALGTAIAVSICLASDTAAPSATAEIGQPAPQFVLQNQNGVDVSLASYAGHIVVLEWTNPDCPFVQRHYREHTMTDLAAKYQPDGVVWLAINSTHGVTNAADKQWSDQQNISYPVLNDSSGTVGHEYGATNTPDMYIIGKTGTLLYEGAIDNDPSGNRTTGKLNYVNLALSEIQAGKAVSIPKTKPYGCTVKYAD
jgi:peroxiredoxin